MEDAVTLWYIALFHLVHVVDGVAPSLAVIQQLVELHLRGKFTQNLNNDAGICEMKIALLINEQCEGTTQRRLVNFGVKKSVRYER